MSFLTNRHGSLTYLTSTTLQGPLIHCFTTRQGGVSAGHLSSLNLGISRGDRPEAVRQNYTLLAEAVGFSVSRLVFARQTHSDIVQAVDASFCGQGLDIPVPAPRDALITRTPGVVLTVFSADCTPILLYDPVCHAVGAVHSGWRGTAAGIVRKTVLAMQKQYGCRPQDIRAAIGPCISSCCFETREDVPAAMEAALGNRALEAVMRRGEKYLVDLKLLNCMWLEDAGITQIDICADCTACLPARYWSHRKLGDLRGSMANMICLSTL